MTPKNIWNRITSSLESTIPKPEIKTWLLPTVLKKVDKETALIEVPNKFVANWLTDNYLEQIQSSFYENLNYTPEIRFIFKGSSRGDETAKYKIPKKSRKTLNHQLNQKYTFNTFFTEKRNKFAYSLAVDFVNKPVDNYNPLFLFGKKCCGKTHLLNAIGNQAISTNSSANVILVSLEKLSTDFSLSKKERRLQNFRETYKNADFLLVDDIHQISGRKNLQTELVSLINVYLESKKRVAFAGKQPAGLIEDLLPELRSRLEWGLICEIKRPEHKTRIKILIQKAKAEKIYLPDDVAFFMANTSSDLNAIFNHLINLGAYSSLNKKPITIAAVKSVIKNRLSKKIEINEVQKQVADYFNISMTDLLSGKKTHRFSLPRHIAMYLCRELTGFPLKEIAKAFGNKDHSTVVYAVKRIKRETENNKEIVNSLNKIRKYLYFFK